MEIDVDEVRNELDAKHESVRAHIDNLGTREETDGATISYGKRIGDATAEAVARMEDAFSAESLQELLVEIERAQAKLDDGSYGVCDECGADIDRFRMEFRPWSVNCTRHGDK